MFNYWLLIIPVLTAVTGLLCARLPFMLLFYPIRPLKFAGFTFQGALPAAQQKYAAEAGTYISSQLPLDALETKINDPANFAKILPMIEIHIDDFLRNKLKEQMPMISMFIGDKTIVSLKEVFIREIGDLFPKIMGQFAGNLKSELNLEKIIGDKIAGIDLVRATSAIEAKIAAPVTRLAWAGFFIGLIIGLLQLSLLLFVL